MLSLTPPNTFNIRHAFARVLEALMLSQHLDAVSIGELFSRWLSDTNFYENNVEDHDSREKVRGLIGRNEVEVFQQ